MGTVFEGIVDSLRDWIERQPMYFVGTAPLDAGGHVNVSPKGPIGSLRVLDAHTIAYLDVAGSGVETIAHVRENGRIVVMLCSFEGAPRAVRLHGRAEVLVAGDPRFDELVERCDFESLSIPESRRAVILVDVVRIADSCGFGVPLMTFEGMRDHHARSSAKKVRTMGAAGYAAHVAERGAHSIDGLPALAP
jgi:hypothetical protein